MVDKARIDNLLSELNDALGSVTPYKLALAAPSEILPVDENAHYMTKRVFDQLQTNIKKDGNLSSLPFCWRDKKGRYIVLSGNHRVEAAVKAGVEWILILYTDDDLSRSQQIGIQLSHNALVGQDNPQLLRELWNQMETLDWKIYSGLDEEMLDTMDNATVVRLNEEALRLEELRLLFLPAEIDRIEEIVKKVGSTDKRRFAGRLEDFDHFFDTLLDFKEAAGIVNTATAFMAIIDIVEVWIKDSEEADTETTEI